jgi:hypothetical protein
VESLLLNAIQTQFEAGQTQILALQLVDILEVPAVRDGVKYVVRMKWDE